MIGMSTNEILDMNASRIPEKEAIVYPRKDQRWTFSEWRDIVMALASGLQDLGVEKGDRVSTLLANGSEIPTALFSSNRIGAPLFPMNHRLAAGEVKYLLNHVGAKVLLFEESTKEIVEKIKDDVETDKFIYIDEDSPNFSESFYSLIEEYRGEEPETPNIENSDPNLLFHTAGTTGKPKVCVHRYGEVFPISYLFIDWLELSEDDVGLSVSPLFHIAELADNFLPRVMAGAKNVIIHDLDAVKILETIEEESITEMFAPPAIWRVLLLADLGEYDLSSFRVGAGAAAPIEKRTVNKLLEEFPMEIFFWGYGQSEYYLISGVDLLERKDKIGSTGFTTLALDNEVRIVKSEEGTSAGPEDICDIGETGEVIVRGSAGPMKEYWKDPEETEKTIGEDGWRYTGDAGYKDEDGAIWLEGRKGDMIISGGENIYPVEVEEVLEAHPKVKEVGVAGTTHEQYGETVTAFIVPKEEDINEEELEEHCLDSDLIADFKRPRRYVFVDMLPKSATGNIQRFSLKEKFEEGKIEDLRE